VKRYWTRERIASEFPRAELIECAEYVSGMRTREQLSDKAVVVLAAIHAMRDEERLEEFRE